MIKYCSCLSEFISESIRRSFVSDPPCRFASRPDLMQPIAEAAGVKAGESKNMFLLCESDVSWQADILAKEFISARATAEELLRL